PTLGEVGPGDEYAEGATPHDHALVRSDVGPGREFVVEGAVGRLERTQIETRCLGPLPGLAREIDMDVRRVGDGDVLEADEPLTADVDDPHRARTVVDRVHVAKLTRGEDTRTGRSGGGADGGRRLCRRTRRGRRGKRFVRI